MATRTTYLRGLGARIDLPVRQAVDRRNRVSLALYQNDGRAQAGLGVRLRDARASGAWSAGVGATLHPTHRSLGGTVAVRVDGTTDVALDAAFGRRFGPLEPRATGDASLSLQGEAGALRVERSWSIDDDDEEDGYARVRRQ
ncbi:MAG: hypothetical protein RI554_10585, partial [Trueperaceae bacterium]|nr:hypothetical protein [Trueperaceae bacterium]